ncbi:MAG: response regulator [Acidobacteria bacterium]|nr:response regulator [Acidobacteriota bacterium]
MDATLPPVTVVAAVDDLMFASRISTTAKAVGAVVKLTRSPEAAIAAARSGAALVILDLNSARVDPLAIVAALKADPALAGIPTVGFVSHVDTATIEAARQAGVGRILARSAFVEQLPQLLRG